MKASDIFTFGKYKGKTLKEACAENGNYVWWCLNNVKGFCIEPQSLEDRFKREYHNFLNHMARVEAYDEWMEEEITDRFDYT